MQEALLEYAATAGGTDQAEKLKKFRVWMEERERPFTCVLDGPNVAYARQNFEGGCFSYHQIDMAAKTLQEKVCCLLCVTLIDRAASSALHALVIWTD